MEKSNEIKKVSRSDVKVLDLVYMAIGAVIITVCSWISIPSAVPFTLQTFAVFLIVALLGGKRGTISILVYILLGAVGVPVFSGMTGGFMKLVGMTGGYIIGFIFIGLIYWLAQKLFGINLTGRSAVGWKSSGAEGQQASGAEGQQASGAEGWQASGAEGQQASSAEGWQAYQVSGENSGSMQQKPENRDHSSNNKKAAGRSVVITVITLITGLLVCYAFGTAWFMVVYAGQNGAIGLGAALGMCVTPFILPDLAKMAVAIILAGRLKKVLHI